MRIRHRGGRSYELELTAPDDAYVNNVLKAARCGGRPETGETVLLSSVLVGLRIVAADILGRVVLRSDGDEPPPGDGNPSDA
jgi:hypothetical protein